MEADRPLRSLPHSRCCLAARARFTAMALMLFTSLSLLLQAQQQASDPYTFHVYEDLVQVPTLVLNRLHGSYLGLTPGQFSVELDKGPAFHPRHVRLQGDDPVSFAVLLDVSDKEGMALAQALPAALGHLSPDLLQSDDALSVFAADCVLVRSIRNTPATLPLLQMGVTNALAAPQLHETGAKPRCGDGRRLWDSMATIAAELGTEPGRRVLLVLSDGFDEKSRRSWESARQLATASAVTVVAIRPAELPAAVDAAEHDHPFTITTEDPLSLFCGETGGIHLYGTPHSVALDVKRLVELLRNRYILEFARPLNSTSGYHTIDVSTSDKHAIVRTSGASFPLQDKAKLSDPQTLSSDPSRAPVFGTRKVLTPPQ